MTLDKLATIVEKGFLDAKRGRSESKSESSALKHDVTELKRDVDNLARFTKESIDGIDHRFDRQESRLINLSVGLEEVKNNLELCAMQYDMTDIKQRVARIESKISI